MTISSKLKMIVVMSKILKEATLCACLKEIYFYMKRSREVGDVHFIVLYFVVVVVVVFGVCTGADLEM